MPGRELTRDEKRKIVTEVMEGKRDASDLEKYGISEDDDLIDDDTADDMLKTSFEDTDAQDKK